MRYALLSASLVACTLAAACTESPGGTAPLDPNFASVRFIARTTAVTGPDDAGLLTVSFRLAGFGNEVSADIILTADATAFYACRNTTGDFPGSPATQEVMELVTQEGLFNSNNSGQVTGSLTLAPPSGTLECPTGQHVVLVAVSYTGVQLSNPDAGAVALQGSFERTFHQL